jgi:hypothetical protein
MEPSAYRQHMNQISTNSDVTHLLSNTGCMVSEISPSIMGIFSSMVTLCSIAVSVSSSPIRDSGILLESRYAPGPVVDLGYAKYQGSTDLSTNITSFLSIRYAAPPIGESITLLSLIWLTFYYYANFEGSLRFQAPCAPAHTSIIWNATSLPPPCYQANGGSSPTNPFVKNVLLPAQRQNLPMSEDCLFLE